MKAPVPDEWNLAPQRKRPLSLWDPRDYLVLLYWLVWFPQALRWHRERFPEADRSLRWQLAFLTGLAWPVMHGVTAWLSPEMTSRTNLSAAWPLQFLLSIATFIVFIDGRDVSERLAIRFFGILSFVSWIYTSRSYLPPVLWNQLLIAALYSSVFGQMLVVAAAEPAGARNWFPLHVGLWLLIVLSACGVATQDPGWPLTTAALIATVSAATISFLAFGVPGLLLAGFQPKRRRIGALSRTVWLPIPGLQSNLEAILQRDWQTGMRVLDHVLRYSLQFQPAWRAVARVLANCSTEQCLQRISDLVNNLYAYEVLQTVQKELESLSRAHHVKDSPESGLEVSATILAGYSSWYTAAESDEDTSKARCLQFIAIITTNTQSMIAALKRCQRPGAAELAGIASAILQGLKADRLDTIAAWRAHSDWLENLPDDRLRPQVCVALTMLREVATEVDAAQTARAPLNRERALDRAAAVLQRMSTDSEPVCPRPERGFLVHIASSWLNAVERAGGNPSREQARTTAFNPYEGYSGLPVSGTSFIGRNASMRAIERLLHRDEAPPVIVLYGHRRMGKTSILRNLEHGMPEGTIVVYLDMQGAGLVDDTGQFFLELAEVIHARISAGGSKLDPGPAPDEADFQTTGRARRALDKLLAHVAPQMTGRRLIVAIDEFEVIETGLDVGRIDADVLHYLRSVNQRYAWLALIFGGLHTLAEMNGAYWSAFYSQTQNIPVSYLSEDDARRLIEKPHPDFTLTYEPALVDELYRLTHGQPYLLQRLCWELVERWNRRLADSRDGEDTETAPAPVLALADLPAILDRDMFLAAAYYFEGVWAHGSDSEKQLLTALSQRAEPWPADDVVMTCPQITVPVLEVLEAALHRDVLLCDERDGVREIRFASELMRQWVASQANAPEHLESSERTE